MREEWWAASAVGRTSWPYRRVAVILVITLGLSDTAVWVCTLRVYPLASDTLESSLYLLRHTLNSVA